MLWDYVLYENQAFKNVKAYFVNRYLFNFNSCFMLT